MKTLKELREDIDKIDARIIKSIAAREKKVRQIGELKKRSGKLVKDPEREKKLTRMHTALCEALGISPTLVKEIFALIILHSRKVQQ